MAVRAGIEAGLNLEIRLLNSQLLGIRIPAFRRLCSGFNGRLNSLRALFLNRFDQSEFVRSISLRPPESGDEFGMGKGWIHKSLIV